MRIAGESLYQRAKDLFPMHRSLTGKGVEDTLHYLKKILPGLKICTVASGTRAFDWTVPEEWNVKEAWIQGPDGKRFADIRTNNLHLVSYSVPVNQEMDLGELEKHLHSLPEQPTAIPYITSYYKKRWGFCLSHNERKKLKPGKYKVFVDSTLQPGKLTYGELILPGASSDEILLSTYICHPSMGNNETSGPVVASATAEFLLSLPKHRYTYRFLFLPETIGSIVYLSRHLAELQNNVKAGFVLSCLGDNRTYSMLGSRLGDTLADKAAKHILDRKFKNYKYYSYIHRGSDERQFGAPGVDLPVCSLMRTKYGEYPEYHTSLDDLKLISAEGLKGGLDLVADVLELLEANRKYRTKILCEPQLGKRGLYPTTSTKDSHEEVFHLLNLISYSDGNHDLIDIAEKLEICALDLVELANKLVHEGVIEQVG